MSSAPKRSAAQKIRYAVVGLGHIAQAAVLPAIRNAKSAALTALVSDDPAKRKALGRKYKVLHACAYDEYDALLKSGDIDAVYVALPNHLHRDYTVRAARAGVHVLCEKPMAVTEEDCTAMMRAARENDVKLMIAYRLHFEEANLRAVELVRAGKLGRPRFFSSDFAMQVKPGDIRLFDEKQGGGALYDIGVYCINAARALFRAEPTEVFAASARGRERRFKKVDEAVSAVLRFPDERLASFTVSFGAADVSSFRVVGTKGDLRMDPAYEYEGELTQEVTLGGKKKRTVFAARDHFGPELEYFAQCVLKNKTPEPSGAEGLADVRVVRALEQSLKIGKPVRLAPFTKNARPGPSQEMRRPAVAEPALVHAEPPSA